MNIKRWEVGDGYGTYICNDGDWVAYHDVEDIVNRVNEIQNMLSRLVKENDLAMPDGNHQWMYSPMRVECLKVLENNNAED